MKSGKVLGYFETKSHLPADSNNYRDHDEGDITHHFIVEVEDKKYTFSLKYSYGSCGWDYSTASWGYINNKLVPFTSDYNYIKPRKDIFINVSDDVSIVYTLEKDPIKDYDSMITYVQTLDNDELYHETGNGGCGYYPSGMTKINTELFYNA